MSVRLACDRQRIYSNSSIHTCDWVHGALGGRSLFAQVVPEDIELVVAERHPGACLNCRSSPISQHVCLLRWHQEAASKDLASVVNGQVHMLTALALAVEPNKALCTEEVYTILA